MHMRKKKNRDVRLQRVEPYFAKTDEEGSVLLQETFEHPGELYLEIGCGKGAFCTELSRRVAGEGKNILAVELITDALLMAMEKCASEDCKNLKFLNANAENIGKILPPHSVSRLFLNFSDPWPKNRDREKRLTSCTFLGKYKEILAPDARIIFKTDNRPLFDFSLTTFPASGYVMENVCFDLHADPMNETNIETEYEKKFSEKGFKINYLEAYLPKENP